MSFSITNTMCIMSAYKKTKLTSRLHFTCATDRETNKARVADGLRQRTGRNILSRHGSQDKLDYTFSMCACHPNIVLWSIGASIALGPSEGVSLMNTHSSKKSVFQGLFDWDLLYKHFDLLCGLSLLSCCQVLVWHHCRQVFTSCSA